MKTVPKLLILASIGMLVFFTTHLVFFDTEVKKLITLNGVDHILHHIVLLKFLVGAIFTALCGVIILDHFQKDKSKGICKDCCKYAMFNDSTECIDCKISKI